MEEALSSEVVTRGKHRVVLYTLSYCAPCKDTMDFLEENGIDFEYTEVDKANPKEREGAITVFEDDLPSKGRRIAFPIIVIDDETVITGFDKTKLSKTLGIQ
ncbi:MAG: glutaredoxin family protein [Candidatus Bathyarchaeia archaeon]